MDDSKKKPGTWTEEVDGVKLNMSPGWTAPTPPPAPSYQSATQPQARSWGFWRLVGAIAIGVLCGNLTSCLVIDQVIKSRTAAAVKDMFPQQR